jgi:hypothetical protein
LFSIAIAGSIPILNSYKKRLVLFLFSISSSMKKLVLICIVWVAQASYAQQNEKMLTFSNPLYSIGYPASWKLDTSGKMGTQFFVFSPLQDNTDRFSENVNLIIQDLKGQRVDLLQYKQITDEQLASLPGTTVFQSEIAGTKNAAYYVVNYTMKQGNQNLRIVSRCYIKNEKAYLLTFSAAIAAYQAYQKTGEAILASFVLQDK